MKKLLLAAGLLLAGCSGKKDEPAPDLFLGHWQSEAETVFTLDAAGNVVTPAVSYPGIASLDVTSTTMSLYSGTKSIGNGFGYTRDGEVLVYAGRTLSDPNRYYARSLTATSFTLEEIYTDIDGKKTIDRLAFHR